MSNTPTLNDDSELTDLLGGIDADFGYAVGNLNMDTTPESRAEIIDKVRSWLHQHDEARDKQHEIELTQVIEERDTAEEWADKLAYAKLGIEQVGEHSNMNNPWTEALELLQNEANPDKGNSNE